MYSKLTEMLVKVEYSINMHGWLQVSLVMQSEECLGCLIQLCRRDSQTCRELVYRHSCIVFALAWFYRRISLPPAVELEVGTFFTKLRFFSRGYTAYIMSLENCVCAWHVLGLCCHDNIKGICPEGIMNNLPWIDIMTLHLWHILETSLGAILISL